MPTRARTPRTPKVRLRYEPDDEPAHDHTYEAVMEVRTCPAPTNRHHRCKRRVRYGLPYCADHTKRLLRVQLCRSEHGSGMSAWDPATVRGGKRRPVFAKGDLIVPYSRHVPIAAAGKKKYDEVGPFMPIYDGAYGPLGHRHIAEYITDAELERRYPGDMTAPYAYKPPGGQPYVFDAVKIRSIGAMANDSRDSGRAANAIFAAPPARYRPTVRPEVWLRAERPIYHTDPILVDYSDGYWEGVQPEIAHAPHYRPRCRRSARRD